MELQVQKSLDLGLWQPGPPFLLGGRLNQMDVAFIFLNFYFETFYFVLGYRRLAML